MVCFPRILEVSEAYSMTPLGTFGRRTQVHQAFKTLIPSFTPMSGGLRVCVGGSQGVMNFNVFFWFHIDDFLVLIYWISPREDFFFTSSRHSRFAQQPPHLDASSLTVWPCFCGALVNLVTCGSWGKSMSTTKSLFQACKMACREQGWNLEHFEIWYQVQGALQTSILQWKARPRENDTWGC